MKRSLIVVLLSGGLLLSGSEWETFPIGPVLGALCFVALLIIVVYTEGR